MNSKIRSLVTLFAGVVLCPAAFAKAEGGGKHFVFNLVGTGHQYERTVPDIDGDGFDDPAICFDVSLVNMKNQQLVGSATDCLSQIEVGDTGIALVGTTYFHLSNGSLITRGRTTVAPVLHETITPAGQVMTHVTGASSDDYAILGGDGRFGNANGTARLSGMVDLSGFGGVEGDPITFDCLFVIDIE